MNISQFMADNTPAKKSNSEIDCLIKPFSEDINRLLKSGYDIGQTMAFLKSNGIHLSLSDIMFS